MVTSQKEQIQSLIADIERVLGTEKPRTPWIKASEIEPQRQALARAQSYLMSLQQLFEAPGGWGPVDPTTGQLDTQVGDASADQVPGQISDQSLTSRSLPSAELAQTGQSMKGESAEGQSAKSQSTKDQSAEDLLQALRTEMKFLKASALQPLRLEIDSLQSTREVLQEEIKALEDQRSQINQAVAERTDAIPSNGQSSDDRTQEQAEISEAQLNEFLAALMERLQENLSVQVTQTLVQMESDHASAIAAIAAATESERLSLQPSREQQIEEMRQLQSRSDQLLVNIDSTLQRMFETLQSNINSYQISLNEGIENMHSLGRQGEVIVRSLVDHLTAQLGQTAPPEPAFFPPRDASALPTADIDDFELDDLIDELAADRHPEEVPTVESEPELESAIETDSSLGEFSLGNTGQVESSDEESIYEESADDSAFEDTTVLEAANPDQDTVSSLDEILPEILPEESLQADSAADASNPEEVFAEDVLAAEDPIAEQDSDLEKISEVDPATFIREDGTIDVDLLKLDIDRSDEDDEPTLDDIMVDAAIADSRVAATEIEDPEIEAKVTPTADAAFLAGLTIADLTVDELTLNDLSVPDLAVEGADSSIEVLDTALGTNDSEVYSAEVHNTEIYSTEAQPEDEEEQINEEVNEEVTENDIELAAVLPDLGPPMAPVLPPTMPLLEETTSEETTSEETTSEEMFLEAVSNSEENFVEDNILPEFGGLEEESIYDESIEDGTADFDSEIEASRPNEEPSEDLLDTLEEDNQASIRNALETSAAGTNQLVPDLEEPTVSDPTDAAIFSRSATAVSTEPLESALIPDQPTEEPIEDLSIELTDEFAEEPTEELTDEFTEESTEELTSSTETLNDGDDENEADSYFESRNFEEAPVDSSEEAEVEGNQPESEVLESSLTPDLPEVEEKTSDDLPSEESDIGLSDELRSSLEEDNQASIRNAFEMPEVGTDELVSDLEEPIVSELPDEDEAFSSRSALPMDTEPLESALIPDEPTGEVDEPQIDEPQIDDQQIDELQDNERQVNELQDNEQQIDELQVNELQINEPTADEQQIDELRTDELQTDESTDDLREFTADERADNEFSTDLAESSADAVPVSTGDLEEEMPVEDLFIEDFAYEGSSVESLPPTGVEDLISDDTELLATLGQPDVGDLTSVFDDDPDFFQLDQPGEDQQLIEDQTVEDQTVEDQTAEEQLAEDQIAEQPLEYPVENQPEDASLVDAIADESIDSFSTVDQRNDDPSDLTEWSSSALLTAEPDVEDSLESAPASTAVDETILPPADDEGMAFNDSDQPTDWFLGIDLGTTGLSAVLMERRTHRMYELCWSVAGDSEANRFRLPAVASIDTQGETGQLGIGVVGPAALQIEDAPLMRSLKPMVKAGIPDDFSGEPWMQWSDQMSLPLIALQTAIADLLRTLSGGHMSCHAVGLKDDVLHRALTNLQGVIVGYPTNWPDTYSFNIREAVLSAELVIMPDQIFFVEDAIASLLSALPAPGVDISGDNQQPGLYNCSWSGGTVVVSAGATLTEVSIADLPKNLARLSYSDFSSRSYTYAGDSIDQDIICQLLHLPVQNEASGNEASGNEASEDEVSSEVGESSQPSLEAWESLGLDQLKLPRPGEADRTIRHRLRQRLNDSVLGRQALAAAQDLKMMLQEDEEVDVQLGDRTWIVTRKELEAKVFAPYIQRLNRLTSALLNQKPLSAQSIKQVICTGGAASLGVISDWLRQKFPNATIIQDTYSGEYSNSCSRVAYGLANLCHYPDVLDADRHRYNDYFLLLELLRTLPEQPLPAGGIMHLLSQRGIDVQACHTHLLALIEGHLPPGLVPTEGDRPLISAQSSDIENYRLLAELPLFRKQGGQVYIADLEQGERLRTYLESLLTTKAQSLNEPMATSAMTAMSTADSV